MKKSALLLLLAAMSASASAETYYPASSSAWDGTSGIDFSTSAPKSDRDTSPYYYSVALPDGNYRVTLEIGSDKRAAETTVRAESRRLLVENLPTRKGETVRKTFTVNKRTPIISDNDRVRIKEREKTKLDWDDRLTFEINGKAPALKSITITPADSTVTTVYLCGNSTVVDQEEEPWASWGQMVPRFFDENVSIANYAESGESANTFIAAGRLRRALRDARPGDWFFVEFGHNDQKQRGPGKGAWYSFATSLKTFVDEARLKGCNIVFVTPTRRRVFDTYGASVNTHEDFPDAMREVAAREGVPVIELNGMTARLYETLGTEDSKCAFVHYPAGTFPGQKAALADNTHFNPYGAYQVAKCVIEGMRTAAPALFSHVVDFTTYSPSSPDDFATFFWAPAPIADTTKPDGN
ncbi:MAG: rhamnogalacturonan acetylesterase [Duncaniella sp.]|nr:rhamnogalacturonan acetylesterase [Duncaniella sp.]